MTASNLVPHVWDSHGAPPPLGPAYEADSAEPLRRVEPGDRERVLRLIRDAEAAEERALDLESEADEKRQEAAAARAEAEDIVSEWPAEVGVDIRATLRP